MKCSGILCVLLVFIGFLVIAVHGSRSVVRETLRQNDEDESTTEKENIVAFDYVYETQENATENIFEESATMTTESENIDIEIATVQPTEQQKEIITELQNIWNFKERLKTKNSALTGSLESLVHLSFARIQTEPEETLDQLKYLLSMLRAKLSKEEADLFNSNQQRSKRSPLLQTEIFASESHSNDSRNFRSVENFDFKGEVSPMMNDVVSDLLTKSALTKEQTIQKMLLVKDYVDSHEPLAQNNNNEQKQFPIADKAGKYASAPVTAEQLAASIINLLNRGNSFQNNATGFIHTSTSPTTTPQPSVLIPILTLHETSEPVTTERVDSWINEEDIQYFQNYLQKIKRKHEHKKKIKNALLKLNMLPETTVSTTTTTSTHKPPLSLPAYFHTLFPGTGLNSEDSNINEDKTPSSIEMIRQTTTARTNYMLNQKYHQRKTSTISASDYEAYDDYLLESTDMVTSEYNNDGEITIVPTPTFAQIMNELSSGNVVITPVSVFNGTREAASLFLATFERLSFPVKMITLFILSVSILTITLGIYSLGPPILAVGALGILIPIVLFILFRTDDSKRLYGNTLKLGKQDKMEHDILDLIDNAIKMYN